MLGVGTASFPGTPGFILSTGHARWSSHLVFSATAYLRETPVPAVGPRCPWELTAQGEREADVNQRTG